MPCQPLPYEIQMEIIQSVYIISQSRDVDYRTLSSCALVCRDWVAPAQRLLYRRIPHSSGQHARESRDRIQTASLLHALTSSPHLCAYVRSLPTDILTHCYYPKALGLSFAHIWELRYVHKQLRTEVVRAAGLRPSVVMFYRFSPRPEDLAAVLEALPSVRYLVLRDNTGLFKIKLPHNAQLLSLKCENTIDFAQVSKLPGPGAHSSEISFQDLHLGYLHFPGKTLSVERCIARNLRSLTVWMLVPSNATLEQLTTLESLVIGGLPTMPLALPRTLQHFGLHQRFGVTMDQGGPSAGPLAASLSESALPVLRVVSVTRYSKAYVRHALKTASAARGTEFLEYADAGSYPRARYVDWI
ncbi:hypothetical protein FA95DRAFT_1605518 [Auriscalpium vulgare]|uniref:Uncharacterized protein n=1 Tax=Auriscalpium vulgare TaxID=40419 RepID=A0ACB8RVV1_9AGAM|nr:hypothetical protein FA95DRAFT_1605518 [Auriscalpium vulgare]